jgi:uncharacterized protein YjgD (DUF1641 family)
MEITLEAIISLLGLFVGGGGGCFFTWRWMNRRAKAEAKEKEAEAKSAEVDMAQKVQDTYQEMLEDKNKEVEDNHRLIAELREDRDHYKKGYVEMRDEVDKLFARMYEDRVNGTITEQNFTMLSQKYQTEQAELAEKIEKLTVNLETVKQTEADAEKWIALLKQFSDPDQLDATLLNTLIEKILVHEAEKDEIGTRTQDVDIYYRFVGKIA